LAQQVQVTEKMARHPFCKTPQNGRHTFFPQLQALALALALALQINFLFPV